MWRMQLQPFTPGKCNVFGDSFPYLIHKGVRQILFHSFGVSTWAASFRQPHGKMKISWKELYFVSLSFQSAFSKERNELPYMDHKHEKYTKCLLCAYVCVWVATEDWLVNEYVCNTRVTSDWNQFQVSSALFHITGYWCTHSSTGRTFCSYKSHLLCESISWSSSRDCYLNCCFCWPVGLNHLGTEDPENAL